MGFRLRHPPGSTHPVLAHPTREIFALDQLGEWNSGLVLLLVLGVFLFLLPYLFMWIVS